MEIRPVGAELFHADRGMYGWTDGRTDMTKLIIAFHNFSKAPTNMSVHLDGWLTVHLSVTMV